MATPNNPVDPEAVVSKHLDIAMGEDGETNNDATTPDTSDTGDENKEQLAPDVENILRDGQSDSATSESSEAKPAEKGKDVKAGEDKSKPANSEAKPGDLTDPSTGEVIARAGAERRIYERAEKRVKDQYQGALQNIENQFRTEFTKRIAPLEAKVQAYEQANSFAQTNQITPTEQLFALQLVHSLKTDPGKTISNMLAQARADGIVVEGFEGAVDMAAIDAAITKKLAPVTDRYTREAEENGIREEVQQEYNNFISTYPDARIHEESIAYLVEKGLPLERAYYKLRLHAQELGLDWTKPLAPQVEARKQTATNTTTNQATLPTGGKISQTTVRDTSTVKPVASEHSSWADIVRNAMKTANQR